VKVLVTGAAGLLGSHTCKALFDASHEVVATDCCYNASLPVTVHVADLLDAVTIYPLIEGCDALVHLGNHPNLNPGKIARKVYSENCAMNANVFQAAVEVGVKRWVFSSSVQTISGLAYDGTKQPGYRLPYLPLDCDVPARPGTFYAHSKVAAEVWMQGLCHSDEALSATSLRFPPLPTVDWLNRLKRRVTHGDKNATASSWYLAEALSYLMVDDAASLIVKVVENQKPGYHQYMPTALDNVLGMSVIEAIEKYYSGIPLRKPIEQIDSLIDNSAITEQVAWQPEHPGLAGFSSSYSGA